VLPIVRYWIPHIRIISPEGAQVDMEQELARYLDCITTTKHPRGKN